MVFSWCQLSNYSLPGPFKAVRTYTRLTTITHVRDSKFNSLLMEIITPQTYKYIYIHIHIKPLPVSRVFGARSGSPRIKLWPDFGQYSMNCFRIQCKTKIVAKPDFRQQSIAEAKIYDGRFFLKWNSFCRCFE